MSFHLPLAGRINKALIAMLVITVGSFSNISPVKADYTTGIRAIQEGDFHTAISELRETAEEGDVRSQYYLGVILSSEEVGAMRDNKEAFTWILKAAEQGLALAENRVGVLFRAGLGVTKNSREAIKWLRRAAEQGLKTAEFNLGDSLYIEEDYSEAIVWYRKAADQGLTDAVYKLGVLSKEGNGTKQNYSEAYKYFKQAAEKGHTDAQIAIGKMYRSGEGLAKDPSEAVKWIRKAADKGVANAENILGSMYFKGEGVPKDKVEALRWFRKSAEQGDAHSQMMMGLSYLNGTGGVDKDNFEAVSWLRKAVKGGEDRAEKHLEEALGSTNTQPDDPERDASNSVASGMIKVCQEHFEKFKSWKAYYKAFAYGLGDGRAGCASAVGGDDAIAKCEKTLSRWNGECWLYAMSPVDGKVGVVWDGPPLGRKKPKSTQSATNSNKPKVSRQTPSKVVKAFPSRVPATIRDAHRDAIAVVIGNRDYKGETPKVSFAINDANAVSLLLQNRLGYRVGNIIDLRDASLNDMAAVLGNERTPEGKLHDWIRPGQSDVFVFYSGHGVPGLKDKRPYLLPVDGDANRAEITGYPLDVLYKNLAKLPAKSVTVFIDACFSGDSPEGMIVKAASGISLQSRLPEATGNMTIITAAQGDQLASWDENAKLGLFTKHLLEALEGKADTKRYGNENGKVSLDEVRNYLDQEMTYQARRKFGRTQNVSARGDGGAILADVF